MKEYHFPLVTDEYRIAFLQATEALCPDIQRLIWHEVLYCTQPIDPPPTPRKCPTYSRLSSASLPRNLLSLLNES
jgi:hypothetical protein